MAETLDVTALYIEHRAGVLAFLRRRVGVDAEDVAQDVWERAWAKRARFRPPGDPRGWLYTIAARVAIDHYRARAVRPIAASGYDDALSPELADHADQVVARVVVDELLATLSDPMRHTVRMHCLAGLSASQTATQLSIPPGTVKSRAYYALAAMRAAAGGRR